MTNTEYEEYLKQSKRDYKNRFLKEYKEFPIDGKFRKLKKDIHCDYEFIEDAKAPTNAYFDPKSKRNGINSISLYFIKLDNDTCEEILTGKLFVRIYNPENDYTCFYNEETGLYFDFNNYFEKAIGMIIDNVYANNALNYFNYFERLKEEDDRLRSKSLSLMLKKQMNYSKEK